MIVNAFKSDLFWSQKILLLIIHRQFFIKLQLNATALLNWQNKTFQTPQSQPTALRQFITLTQFSFVTFPLFLKEVWRHEVTLSRYDTEQHGHWPVFGSNHNWNILTVVSESVVVHPIHSWSTWHRANLYGLMPSENICLAFMTYF